MMAGIEYILNNYKTIAVVGLSRDESKYSYKVSKFMQDAGYTIIPINPSADTLLGQKCYKDLGSIPAVPDVVDVFRPAAEALDITKQAVSKGAKAVWLQEGIVNDAARDYAAANGVEFVQNRCIMKEYLRYHEGA